jgi:hypothetical protein
MATAKLKDNQVKVRFPTAQECIDYEGCDGVNFDGDVRFKSYINADHEPHKEVELLSFPLKMLGKEIVLTKNPWVGVSYENKTEDIAILDSELTHFNDVVKVIEGTLLKPPLVVADHTLSFDSEDNIFRIGCKKIDMKLADQVFHFLGEHLGYAITT